ncbi:MAG: hypothetical protein UT65_C0002G0029 [Parcubacteria group bacterium GW2011_GWF2_39_8b]|nr:MAG: hypothetical protein UT65_C0002G0029 [Parcubacteria group bacterium GW2011_GWF2_39_8b]KKR46022.1 MAG: hypothetical protein UT81_C0003G0039 [Parcubacteria group bacterium GW2011_GWA2_40_14]
MKHIYHSVSKIDEIGLFAGENIKNLLNTKCLLSGIKSG